MATLTYQGTAYACSKAVRGTDFIHLYDANNNAVASFDGITDFSGFSLAGCTWSSPDGAEVASVLSTSVSNGKIVITTDTIVGTGTLLKFYAPCDCASVTSGLEINGVLYSIVDAMHNNLVGMSSAWKYGALISALLDVTNKRAFILNVSLKTYIDNKFTEAMNAANAAAKTANDAAGTANSAANKADSHTHEASDISGGTLHTGVLPIIPVIKGGTGGKNAIEARSNLGIGFTRLYSDEISTVGNSITFAYGSYSAYLIVGYPQSGNARVSTVVPADLIIATDVSYQLSDNISYVTFKLKCSANTVTLTLSSRSGSGAIIAVYGIN